MSPYLNSDQSRKNQIPQVQDWVAKGLIRDDQDEAILDLEKFFVPEGKGNPPRPITVEVAVAPDGRGRINKLMANGQPWP